MTNASLNTVVSLFEALKRDFFSSSPNYKQCGELLTKLKIALIDIRYLNPSGPNVNQQQLLLTREILEIGALWSIRVKDIPAFERYMAQLKTYYWDYGKLIPPSSRMYTLIGLDLLRLLSQNRISEFHCALELVDPEQLSNVYIKQPIQLEQYLMEGSYNKVWNSRVDVPAEEYLFFIDILMQTIRNEIASCSEKSYDSLPLSDAATLLFFKNLDDLVSFSKARGWNVNPSQKIITFGTTHMERQEIPSDQMMLRSYQYARELERIV